MQRARRDSILATILFTDIVGSSDLVAELGDRRWRILLSRHNALIRRELRRHGGRELDTAGDGFFASFENPGNAIRCAATVVEGVQNLGIDLRIGLHLGQAELVGRKLGGAAVHIGARVMGLAGPADVLVTGVLKDVLPASDFSFEDRGSQVLKGVPGEWRLFRVTAVEKPLPGPLEPGVAAERRAAVEAPPLWRRSYVPAMVVVAVVVAGAVSAAVLLGDGPSPLRSAPVDYVARVNPSTREIMARIAVGRDPIDVAVGEGSVWVLDHDGSVRRIDPVTNEVILIQRVAEDPRAIAVGAGAIWVADGTESLVRRIDPASDSVVAPIPTGGVAADVAVGEGAVWVAARSGGDDHLFRIDPSSGGVVEITGDTSPDLDLPLIAVSDGFVWDANGAGLNRYGVATSQFHTFHQEAMPRGIDAYRGDLWITFCGTPGTVVRVDPRTGDVLATISAGGAVCDHLPIGIVAKEEGVWVADLVNGSISRIREIDNRVGPPIRIGDTPSAVAAGLGSVWVTVDGEALPSPSTS